MRSAWVMARPMSRCRPRSSFWVWANSRSACSAVRGVPISWAASATKRRKVVTVCSVVSAMALNDSARLPISSARSTLARTLRSPRAMPSLAAVMASKGRVKRLLTNQPTSAASTTAATPASSQAKRVVRSTALPYAGPCETRRTATTWSPETTSASAVRLERGTSPDSSPSNSPEPTGLGRCRPMPSSAASRPLFSPCRPKSSSSSRMRVGVESTHVAGVGEH